MLGLYQKGRSESINVLRAGVALQLRPAGGVSLIYVHVRNIRGTSGSSCPWQKCSRSRASADGRRRNAHEVRGPEEDETQCRVHGRGLQAVDSQAPIVLAAAVRPFFALIVPISFFLAAACGGPCEATWQERIIIAGLLEFHRGLPPKKIRMDKRS